jgi:hypothetical protein
MTAMDKDTLSYARTDALRVADALHLAYFTDAHARHYHDEAHRYLADLAETMGYTIQPKDVTRHKQTIEAAGMGGNGFAGAEFAAHCLTVARNGGA